MYHELTVLHNKVTGLKKNQPILVNKQRENPISSPMVQYVYPTRYMIPHLPSVFQHQPG